MYENLKTVQDACTILGKDYTVLFSDAVMAVMTPHEIAYRQMCLTVDATNYLEDGKPWAADYTDDTEKYEVWMNVENGSAGPALSLVDVFYNFSTAVVGARLSFKSRAGGKFHFETFKGLYETLVLTR